MSVQDERHDHLNTSKVEQIDSHGQIVPQTMFVILVDAALYESNSYEFSRFPSKKIMMIYKDDIKQPALPRSVEYNWGAQIT